MLKPAAGRLPPERVDWFKCKAISPRYTVGSRQAEHKLYRELIKEDNMVKRG